MFNLNTIKKTTTAIFGLTLLAGSLLIPTPEVQAADGTLSVAYPSGETPTGNEAFCIYNATSSEIIAEIDLDLEPVPAFQRNLPSGDYTLTAWDNPDNIPCNQLSSELDISANFVADIEFSIFPGETTYIDYSPNTINPGYEFTTAITSINFLDTSKGCNNGDTVLLAIGESFSCDFSVTNGENFVPPNGIVFMKLRNIDSDLQTDPLFGSYDTCYFANQAGTIYSCNFQGRDLPAGEYEILVDFGTAGSYQNTGVFVTFLENQDDDSLVNRPITCEDYVISKDETLTCYVDLPDSLSSTEKQNIVETTKLGVTYTSYVNPEGNFYNSEYQEYAGDCVLYGEDDLKCTFEFGELRKTDTYNMYIGIPSSDGVVGFFDVTYLADGTVKIKTLRTGGFDN